MTKRNVFIIILSLLLFLSAAVLGVSAVYRVNEITVFAPAISDEAKTEAEDLKKRLLEAYKKQSTFFADREEADKVMEDFPYFRIISFEKAYPNRLVIEVREDAEVYAVANLQEEGTYYILNADGVVLGMRDNPANRSTDGHNVILRGTEKAPLTAVGKKGEVLSGDECLPALFAFVKCVSTELEGIQRNVLTVEIDRPASDDAEITIKLYMKEGVTLYVRNPLSQTEAKAERIIEEYTALGDKQKTEGILVLFDGKDGEDFDIYYSKEDILTSEK